MNATSEINLQLKLTVLKEKYRILATSHECLEEALKGISERSSLPEAIDRGRQIAERESEVRFALENTASSLHS